MINSEAKAIIGVLILCNLILALVFIFSMVHISDISYNYGYMDGYNQIFYDYNISSNDGSENFLRMRDLFTPMPDEMVTVVGDGYHDGGFCFWVNHSTVLDSYFFDDQCSYLVVIPSFGLISVVEPGLEDDY